MINTTLYEINKPSELCQVVFFENYKKGIFAYLTPTQIDLINILFYTVKKEVLTTNKKISDLDKVVEVTIELSDIYNMLNNRYKNDAETLLQYLYELKKVDVMINTLGKVKDTVYFKLTSIIHTIEWSRHKNILNKKITVGIDRDIISSFIDRKNYFAKVFLSLQLSMNSKYSKLLYEILKDYSGIKTKTIDYNILLPLLNVDFENTNNGAWAMFNQNILKKTILEINEKSDIYVEYEPIKEKPEGERLQVTKIKFTMKSQPESRLQELGLIQESIIDNKFYNKSKSKLDRLIKGGYNVIDEEMWLETDIKKNELKYESEMRIDIWLKETEQTDKNFIYESIANSIDECEDPMVIIEDYLIRGLFSKDAFTKNASETIDLLNKSIKNVIEN